MQMLRTPLLAMCIKYIYIVPVLHMHAQARDKENAHCYYMLVHSSICTVPHHDTAI